MVKKYVYKKKISNISKLMRHLRNIPTVTKTEFRNKIKQTITYINLPCAFDIETSSFYYNMEKRACMYVWMVTIDGITVVGRTWEEFDNLLNILKKELGLGVNKRLVLYVHNLAFEFGFIKKRYKWIDLFAREEQHPFKAVTSDGIEFRCSYALSGMSLEATAKDLSKYKVRKKVGDLDYDLIRSSKTPLTKKEWGYCIFDTICLCNYIQEEIERFGDITKIPMTKTGKVRLYCREKCFNEKNKREYKYLMKELVLNDEDEYEMLKNAMAAGFTHANYMNAGEIWNNISSKDETSAYPAMMICKKHPMSRGQWVKVHDIRQIINMREDYYTVFNVEFHNLRTKPNMPDHYLSLARCKGCVNVKTDNGRVISADRLQTTITSDDIIIINKVYDYDPDVIIGRAIRYKLGYLPRPFLECVLDFYRDKTTLKGIASMEGEYSYKKSLLNSTFGCTLCDLKNDIISYDDEWITDEGEADFISKYNNSRNRFLFFPWGVSILSKARCEALWPAILELGDSYCYCDTDCTKYYDPEGKHDAYFEEYNRKIGEEMEKACRINKLNFEDTRPKTKKGEAKPLGVWDDEAVDLPESEWYTDRNGNVIKKIYARRFKTLGSKRYCCEMWDEDAKQWKIKVTIAGLNKKKGSDYIAHNEEGKDPFEFFNDHMQIDAEHSGRLVHFYSDEHGGPYYYELTDYLGNRYEGVELSFVHLEKSEYNLKLSPVYAALLGLYEQRML